MKSHLLTEEEQRNLEEKFPLYSQDGKGGKAVVSYKFFVGNATWWITEGSKEGDDFTMFGIASISEKEWGYISLRELTEFVGRVNVGGIAMAPVKIERDKHFTPCLLKDIPELKELIFE